VHQTSPRARPKPSAHMGDVQALISRHSKLLRAQSLMLHLAEPGTVAQAQRLADHLCLLVPWLGDVSRFARQRATDPQVVLQIGRANGRRAGSRAAFFFDELSAVGVSASAPTLFSVEHTAMREVAFARVADVASAKRRSRPPGRGTGGFGDLRGVATAGPRTSSPELPVSDGSRASTANVRGGHAAPALDHRAPPTTSRPTSSRRSSAASGRMLKVVSGIDVAVFGPA